MYNFSQVYTVLLSIFFFIKVMFELDYNYVRKCNLQLVDNKYRSTFFGLSQILSYIVVFNDNSLLCNVKFLIKLFSVLIFLNIYLHILFCNAKGNHEAIIYEYQAIYITSHHMSCFLYVIIFLLWHHTLLSPVHSLIVINS